MRCRGRLCACALAFSLNAVAGEDVYDCDVVEVSKLSDRTGRLQADTHTWTGKSFRVSRDTGEMTGEGIPIYTGAGIPSFLVLEEGSSEWNFRVVVSYSEGKRYVQYLLVKEVVPGKLKPFLFMFDDMTMTGLCD